jgi:hypothetical protein
MSVEIAAGDAAHAREDSRTSYENRALHEALIDNGHQSLIFSRPWF